MEAKMGPIVTDMEPVEPLRQASSPYQLIMLAASTGCGVKLKAEQVRLLAADRWIQWRAAIDTHEAAEQRRIWKETWKAYQGKS
jgi:hypothetical protein